MKSKFAILVLAFVCQISFAARDAEFADPSDLESRVGELVFNTYYYPELEALYTRYADSKEQFLDGEYKAEKVYQRIYREFYRTKRSDMQGYWDYLESEKKKAQQPMQVYAMLEAGYWSSYAWSARGTGFSQTVTPEGWQLFEERLLRAEKMLKDSKPYASSYPWWYQSFIGVEMGLGRPKKVLDDALQEAVKKHGDYLPIYKAYLYANLPKWGGSWEDVDGFIRKIADKTARAEGDSYYTLLYLQVGSSHRSDFNLFTETPVSWERMKRGFDKLLLKYPASNRYPNSYAAYACMAEDADTYRKVRATITRRLPTEFLKGYEMEKCDARYGMEEPKPESS